MPAAVAASGSLRMRHAGDGKVRAFGLLLDCGSPGSKSEDGPASGQADRDDYGRTATAATTTGPPQSRQPPRAARSAQMLSGTPGSAMPAAVTGHRGFRSRPVPALLEGCVMAAGPACRRFLR